MGDPRFLQTVIMMVRHDRNGALGIVINRPLRNRPLAQLLEALGDKDAAVAGTVRIFAGGPVQPGRRRRVATLAQCLQQGLYLQLCGHDFAAIEERDVGGGFSLRLEVPYRLPPGKPSLATPRNAKADGPFVS